VRLTIERLRTLVLAAGVLLVVALIGFLALGRWKSRLILKEIPKRLGANIQREANGFTYTQSAHGGHTLFKLHASRLVQLKQGGRAELHDVQIELYGQDGNTVDRISGGQFDYDQKAGIASAAGPVEITIMRPRETPVVAAGAHPQMSPKMPAPLANAANTAASGQIDVKTSGLTFNQKTGIATTAERVEFAVVQGQGHSTGATFDSDKGQLILDRDVELNVRRGADTVVLRAAHGEFERNELTCDLRGALANYRNGQATAGQARILFRDDGSATRLDAHDGFTLTSAGGAKIAAPAGSLDFNESNQPTQGRLEGGVTMESANGNRHVKGSAPTAQLAFASGGQLRHAHMERGVTLHSEQNGPAHIVRDWNSPIADIDFRNTARGQLEMASVKGTGGVTITGLAQHPGAAAEPSKMSADEITGEFGPNQELTRIMGLGHASMEQTTAAGVRQSTSGDRLLAQLTPTGAHATAKGADTDAARQIQSAAVDGNVVLTQQQPAKAGEPPQPPMRATARRALYDGGSEWLHLSGNPRVDDGGLQLTADKLDVSQASGDAFAHGNVKATWLGGEAGSGPGAGTSPAARTHEKAAPTGLALGGSGPAHVIASEAQLHRATGEATFRGQARLWQQANSISAPVIVLDQNRQTLVAHGLGKAQPVNLVLLSGSGLRAPGEAQAEKSSTPSVIQVTAGELKYSGAERKATLHGGSAGPVQAETAAVTTSSNDVDIVLLPPGNHAGPEGDAAQLDTLTARGHVVVTSNGRRGTGDQLVYSSETSQYKLTGSSAAQPCMTDSARGMVCGEALIFNSRDDSVNIEGQGHKTLTQTVAPK
jgi:lipopolysaccharide export system protein LptA